MSLESSVKDKKHKVSKNLAFQILEETLIPAQVIPLELESFNIPSELIKERPLDQVQSKILELEKVKKCDSDHMLQFYYKLLQLKNLRTVSELGLILATYNLKFTKTEIEKILQLL